MEHQLVLRVGLRLRIGVEQRQPAREAVVGQAAAVELEFIVRHQRRRGVDDPADLTREVQRGDLLLERSVQPLQLFGRGVAVDGHEQHRRFSVLYQTDAVGAGNSQLRLRQVRVQVFAVGSHDQIVGSAEDAVSAVHTFGEVMGVEPRGLVGDGLFAVLDHIFGDDLAAHQQLALFVDLICGVGHGLADKAGVAHPGAVGQLHRGDADLGHAVAVGKVIADRIEELDHLGTDRAAAGDQKDDALAKEVVAHLPERLFGKGAAECRRAAETARDRHALLKFFEGLFAAVPDGLDRLVIDGLPKQWDRENMRHLVALDGVEDGLRRKVVELHKGAREEREPNVHRDQAEHVIERQKAELLDVALIMLFDLPALPDDLIAVVDLAAELLRRIGADLDVVGGAGGHHQQLRAEPLRHKRLLVGRQLLRHDGAHAVAAFVGEHRLCAAVGKRLFERGVAEPQIEQQRTAAREQDRPKQLQPEKRIVHAQSHDRALGQSERAPQR